MIHVLHGSYSVVCVCVLQCYLTVLLSVLNWLQGVSLDIRCDTAQLILKLCVVGPEVTWSEIMSSDWLRGLLAPPLRS